MMKPNPATSLRDEDDAADAAVLPGAPIPRPATSELPAVDLNDINNARSLAVLSVLPHSRVVDIGCGDGTVVRALAARGCRVWAMDIDPVAARLAEPWCDAVLTGDIETADLDGLLGSERADAILLLDVLEHLRDPAAAIRRLLPFLAPGGKIILSVPHVAHAAVRLRLLTGAFPRTSGGILDGAHHHVFDRSLLHEVLRNAGVRVIDEARVVRSLEETEIPLNLAALPQQAIDVATTGADADTYQFVVTVAPGAIDTGIERTPTVVNTLTEHLHRVERTCRRLQDRAEDLASQVDTYRCEHERLREALEEAREGHRRAVETLTASREELERSEVQRQVSEEQLARATNELVRCQQERRFLRDDVLVKDAYLARLRQQATERQHSHADIRALSERVDELTAKHSAEKKLAGDLALSIREMREELDHARQQVKRAEEIALSNRAMREQLERTERELHRVHATVAATLAQPRYVVADRFNAWAKKARPLHAALKRVWALCYRDE